MSIFHRVEEHGFRIPQGEYVIVSFDTRNRGIWQCRFDETGMSEFRGEPPFETFTAAEQREIIEICEYVLYVMRGEEPKI